MKKLITSIFIATSLLSPVLNAEMNLDQLLSQVKQDHKTTSLENQKREKKFLAEKSKRQSMLIRANGELKKQESISANLLKGFEINEKKLSNLEGDLNLAKGVLGEMFGVIRQVSGDLKGQLQNSVISAQIQGDRVSFAGGLAETKKLPDIADLERLWFELQREMTESGKVVQFTGSVVLPDGEKIQGKITRIGAFNLVSDGAYLSFQSETSQVLKLPRQPSRQFTSLVADLEDGDETLNAFGVDPSRGAILGMLVQTPSIFERIQQGGIVGYIILIILAIGLAIVAERWVKLKKAAQTIKAQIISEATDESNALGKIIAVFDKYKHFDLEKLELKMDEVIIKETPGLTRGINTVKLLSAVAPLLGLLGTVTGMIVTFQSITLFGTGDPKLMAGGISQALITTVLGLVCAIPLLLLHNVIANKSQELVQILEEQSAGLIASRVE